VSAGNYRQTIEEARRPAGIAPVAPPLALDILLQQGETLPPAAASKFTTTSDS